MLQINTQDNEVKAVQTKLAGWLPDAVIKQIPDCVAKCQLNSALRLAHFLAQCAHESAGFTVTEENLHYSAASLQKVFPHHFPGDLAAQYANHPQQIAARIYANRMGNGDEASGDGYTYRGRGYIQLTGKDNYQNFNGNLDTDILRNPDLVASHYALLSAAWFWHTKNLNTVADGGANDNVVTKISKEINGGEMGLTERIAQFNKFYPLLSPCSHE
jgi:putative chitinase